MNLQQLLHHRTALLRQARMANIAFAYQRLGEFAARVARARLHGLVRLRPGDPAGEQPWPALTALDGRQAVLDEHFLDEEIVELMDILGFLGEEPDVDGLTFRLEELGGRQLSELRRELQQAGIIPAGEAPSGGDPNHNRG
jgi:hypothetical protein